MLPTVSVVMTVRNEARHLREAVQRVVTQDYQGKLDLTIAVGPSQDGTQKLATAIATEHSQVAVVSNPSGSTPCGLNAAINASTGEVVVRVDGHSLIPANYVSTAVELLQRTGADNVGGVMAAEGVGPFDRAVAAAMTSRFGVGDAAFHVGGDEGPALTVYLGCFRRFALDRVGGYDESMERAQDWELNLRIRQSGGTVYFSPRLRVSYRPRSDTRALAQQYFHYGKWRREVARRHPDTISLRYLTPPATLLAVLAGAVVGLVGAAAGNVVVAVVGFAPAVAYLAGNLTASVATKIASVSSGEGDGSSTLAPRVRLPLVFATMHGAWGAGFLRGGANT